MSAKKTRGITFEGLPEGFVPTRSATARSRRARARLYPHRPTLKPYKSVHFRREAYNLMIAGLRRAEAGGDPLYPYEYLSGRVWSELPPDARAKVWPERARGEK